MPSEKDILFLYISVQFIKTRQKLTWMAQLLYMTQRWGHHSADGNKSSRITAMKSSTLKYFCQPPLWASLLCRSLFGVRFVRALRAEYYLFRGRASSKKKKKSQAVSAVRYVRSENTPLDSLLYPRDERSSTWASPCCDLAPSVETVNHINMYTFPTTMQQKHFKQKGPFMCCSASQAQSFNLSVIGKKILQHFTQVQVSQRQTRDSVTAAACKSLIKCVF